MCLDGPRAVEGLTEADRPRVGEQAHPEHMGMLRDAHGLDRYDLHPTFP